MSEEPLVPEEEPHDWTSGAGVLNDASNLLKDGTQGADAFDWTFDGVSAGLDVLITAADPFGAALAAGVGWILENIPGISDLWGMLAGNPEEIQRAAITWRNIGSRLTEQGEVFEKQAAVVEGWSGEAAESFHRTAEDLGAIFHGIASDTEFLSVCITGVGMVIAALREVAYWAITDWLKAEVIPEALAALASSWISFGSSIAVFLTWLIISTSVTSAALGEKVGECGVKVAEVYTKIGEMLTKLGTDGRIFEYGVQALRAAGEAVDTAPVWGVRGASRHAENRRTAE